MHLTDLTLTESYGFQKRFKDKSTMNDQIEKKYQFSRKRGAKSPPANGTGIVLILLIFIIAILPISVS